MRRLAAASLLFAVNSQLPKSQLPKFQLPSAAVAIQARGLVAHDCRDDPNPFSTLLDGRDRDVRSDNPSFAALRVGRWELSRDYLIRRGVETPIVPGILPVLSTRQIDGFVRKCGASLPPRLRSELDARGADDESVTQFGIEYATRQAEELLGAGAPGIHFYTLNRARSTTEIVRNLAVGSPLGTGN